jgi:hypothetical protein
MSRLGERLELQGSAQAFTFMKEVPDFARSFAMSEGSANEFVSRCAEGVGSRFRASFFHVVRRRPKTTPDPVRGGLPERPLADAPGWSGSVPEFSDWAAVAGIDGFAQCGKLAERERR